MIDNSLKLIAASDERKQLLKYLPIPKAWSFCNYVVEGDGPVDIRNPSQHPVYGKTIPGKLSGKHNYLGVPIAHQEIQANMGTLCFYYDPEHITVNEGDVALFNFIAQQLSQYISEQATNGQAQPPVFFQDDLFTDHTFYDWICHSYRAHGEKITSIRIEGNPGLHARERFRDFISQKRWSRVAVRRLSEDSFEASLIEDSAKPYESQEFVELLQKTFPA